MMNNCKQWLVMKVMASGIINSATQQKKHRQSDRDFIPGHRELTFTHMVSFDSHYQSTVTS